ncbi:hypothetical protein KCU70_g352, partial [Aureobasidium melanogenum]
MLEHNLFRSSMAAPTLYVLVLEQPPKVAPRLGRVVDFASIQSFQCISNFQVRPLWKVAAGHSYSRLRSSLQFSWLLLLVEVRINGAGCSAEVLVLNLDNCLVLGGQLRWTCLHIARLPT